MSLVLRMFSIRSLSLTTLFPSAAVERTISEHTPGMRATREKARDHP